MSVYRKIMKRALILIWLAVLLLAIGGLFWQNEWVYSLPTPVPAAYKPIQTGEHIDVELGQYNNHNPLFLHFFNPDCPCSKFNIPHFKSLVKQYGDKVNFAVVVMTSRNYTAKQIQDKYDLTIPVLFDTTLAVSCGVYSTPQAAIIDTDHNLYYRGNYNKSRYCTDKKSNYAQLALESLLNKKSPVLFNQLALKAYGCQLPKCTK
jgi:hypothetical protein